MLHARLLLYLDEVARCGSIRKAGERLNVASPSINRQIIALEEALGTPLFERLPRKMVLTAAGELLIDHVRQTMRAMQRTRADIDALKGLRHGQLSLGVASGLAGTLVPRALQAFRHRHPRVKAHIAVLSGPEMSKQVAAGELDLGLGFDVTIGRGVQIISSVAARLGAVVNPEHPLATRASVRLADCAAFPLCIPDQTMAMRAHLDAAFGKASLPLDPDMETNSIEVMRRMALSEPCVTFLTAFDVSRELQSGQLVFIPLRGQVVEQDSIVLIGRRRGLTPIAGAMGGILGEIIHTLP